MSSNRLIFSIANLIGIIILHIEADKTEDQKRAQITLLEEQFDAHRARIKAFSLLAIVNSIGFKDFCKQYFAQRSQDLQLSDHLKPTNPRCVTRGNGITIQTKIPPQGWEQRFDFVVCAHGETPAKYNKITIMKSAMPNCVYGLSANDHNPAFTIDHQTCYLDLGEEKEGEKLAIIADSVPVKEKKQVIITDTVLENGKEQATISDSEFEYVKIQLDSDSEYEMV